MTFVSLTPDSTGSNTGAVTGSSAHAALSDGSDATFVDYDYGEASLLGLSDLSLPSGAILVSAQAFVRVRKDGDGPGSVFTAVAADETKQATTSVTWGSVAETGGVFFWGGLSDAGLDAATLGLACQSLSSLRIYRAWVRVMYLVKPTVTVTAPTSTVTNSRPTVSWTPVFDVHAQSTPYFRQVKIFSQAQYSAGGFNPGSSAATVDSGVQSGPGSSYVPAPGLPDGNYRAYVRVAASNSPDQWSDWAYSQFTVDVDKPGDPTLALDNDDANGRIQVVLDDTAGDVSTSSFQVQRYVGESYEGFVRRLGCSLLLPLGSVGGLTDASGNGRNGTAVGGVTVGGVAGPLMVGDEGATDFDGTNDRVTTTYNPFVNGATRTFMGWAYRDTSGTADALFGGTATSVAPSVVLGSGDQNVYFYSDESGASVGWVDAWPGNGQWVHWALVFNEATNVAELFINGVSKGTRTQTVAFNASPGNFQIGAGASGFYPFDGKLGWVSVHSRALTASEIQGALVCADGSSSSWANVRTELGDGMVAFSGSAVTVYDYEAPNGSTVTYRARAYNSSVPSYSAWVLGTEKWESPDEWIKVCAKPSLNWKCAVRSYQGFDSPANQGVFRPLGSETAVVVSDVPGPEQGTIVVFSKSEQDRELLKEIRLAGPVLLQVPGHPDRYVTFGDRASSRIVDTASQEWHEETLPWTVVERPEGALGE